MLIFFILYDLFDIDWLLLLNMYKLYIFIINVYPMLESLSDTDIDDKWKDNIILKFNKLLNLLRCIIKTDLIISSLERWLISLDWFEIFWDYFQKPHNKKREELWLSDVYSITKINFSSWDHILISTKPIPYLKYKNIIYLDLIKESIHPTIQKMMEEKLLEIHFLEKEYFEKKGYYKTKASEEIFQVIQ